MPATLRKGRLDDAPALTRLFLAARRRAMPYLPDLHSAEDTETWMAADVLGRQDVIVVEVDGHVVGFAALLGEVLEHLYVDPDHQGRGVGSALLERAQETRPGGFRLWLFQRNDSARRFYEARGCQLVETTDGSGNEEREPDALYEWRPVSRS